MTEGGPGVSFIKANESKWRYNPERESRNDAWPGVRQCHSSEEGRANDHRVTCERIKLTGAKGTYDNRSWKQDMSDNLIISSLNIG